MAERPAHHALLHDAERAGCATTGRDHRPDYEEAGAVVLFCDSVPGGCGYLWGMKSGTYFRTACYDGRKRPQSAHAVGMDVRAHYAWLGSRHPSRSRPDPTSYCSMATLS
ncbi:MAG: hypothetical protein ACLP50_29885 [Solirubrobacteraceae bacterium]